MNYAEVISSISINTDAIVIVGIPPEFPVLTLFRSYCTPANPYLLSECVIGRVEPGLPP